MDEYIRRQDVCKAIVDLTFKWLDSHERNNLGSCDLALADALRAIEKLPSVVFANCPLQEKKAEGED